MNFEVKSITDEETLDAIKNEIDDAILDVMERYGIGSLAISTNMNFQGDCFDGGTEIKRCYESAYDYPCRPHRERGNR